ncbi:2-dehydro-3-deoxygluconokinase [Leucobacter exalbidus]|uniref:2-dehydro-3-deoxygluconokinase n=1 Tax=Leucobacter exalbidus TaxID=662960 RepID=A0A940T431_9MICO|nr:sugar kinase [Leucobacter exalbidus]MBP1326807.1 2-dehydro-3-deoxygluconokinase [Leucobacter exalbidus]
MSLPTLHDVLTLGESLALITAAENGKLRRGSALELSFGGAESNVAIGVSRLGGNSAWMGRLGRDAIGELILRELRAECVTTYESRDDEVPTALMVKERPFPGQSRLAYYRRGQAGSQLSPAAIDEQAIASAQVLHITGITAGLGEVPTSALHAAIDAAQAAGRTVSFDVNHRSTLWKSGEEAGAVYREIAKRVNLIFAGEDEAELLVGETDVDRQIDALFALGEASIVVIKLGDEGAVAATREGERLRMPATKISVVDTVGAGDAFVAGWLAEHVQGKGLQECLDTAVACGAFACTGLGDWESLPTRDELAWLNAGDADPVMR